jgi:hypothetical protein
MVKPRKVKMGRPLEDIPLRELVKSIRQDIGRKLSDAESSQASIEPRKQQKKKGRFS